MRATFLAAPLVLALVLHAATAHAQLRLESSSSNLRYTLSDLDPGDALQPSITLNPVNLPSLTVRGWARQGDNYLFDEYLSAWHTEATVPLAPDFAPFIAISASATGGENMATVNGRASVDLNGTPAGTFVELDAQSNAGAFYFELGPRSSVTFSVDLGVAMQADALGEEGYHVGSAGGWLSAGPFTWPGDYDRVEEHFWLPVGQQNDGSFIPSQAWAGTLSVTLDNPDSEALRVGGIQFSNYVYAQVSAVPEPAPVALWLAGSLPALALALAQARSISWRTRRRQRSRPTEYQPK
ncbi:hypothetical protein [Massilia sp. KIM]|uniref:hypothetical protein n=1 Tax=Massilia sp. KIM TaxID=1955422 RepID=UPI001180CD78|nr:hypothetical protein [Massilia sp. KIM]